MDDPVRNQYELPQTAGKSGSMPPRAGGTTQNMVVFGLLYLLLLAVALAGVAFTAQGAWLTYNGLRSANWPSALGTITESRVTTSEPGESQPMYGAEIAYSFRVESRAYTGDTVSFSVDSVNQSVAESQVRKYPKGKAVLVYYDPNDASKSVLEPGFTEDTYILLFSGFMFLAGSLLLGWAVRRLRNGKKGPSGQATAAYSAD